MDWTYNWSIGPAPVVASGTGTVALALGWGGAGADRLLAAAVTTSSVATTSQPDVYNDTVKLTMHVTDQSTHQSGQITFGATINGTVTENGANLTMHITNPNEHLIVGNHMYWVRLPYEMDLQKPGAGIVPTMYALVQTWNVTPIAPLAQSVTPSVTSFQTVAAPNGPSTPEPTSLLLAGLGVSLLGFRGTWRLRRKISHEA